MNAALNERTGKILYRTGTVKDYLEVGQILVNLLAGKRRHTPSRKYALSLLENITLAVHIVHAHLAKYLQLIAQCALSFFRKHPIDGLYILVQVDSFHANYLFHRFIICVAFA